MYRNDVSHKISMVYTRRGRAKNCIDSPYFSFKTQKTKKMFWAPDALLLELDQLETSAPQLWL